MPDATYADPKKLEDFSSKHECFEHISCFNIVLSVVAFLNDDNVNESLNLRIDTNKDHLKIAVSQLVTVDYQSGSERALCEHILIKLVHQRVCTPLTTSQKSVLLPILHKVVDIFSSSDSAVSV